LEVANDPSKHDNSNFFTNCCPQQHQTSLTRPHWLHHRNTLQTPGGGGGGLLDDELFSMVTSKPSPSLEAKITHTAAAKDTADVGVGAVANSHLDIN